MVTAIDLADHHHIQSHLASILKYNIHNRGSSIEIVDHTAEVDVESLPIPISTVDMQAGPDLHIIINNFADGTSNA